jgi:hypothetical protein
MAYACLCVLHAAMRTGENLFTRLLAPLLDAYPTDADVEREVNEVLNPVLEALNMRTVRTNPDTKVVFSASLDGTAVETWIDDLRLAFSSDGVVATDEWALADDSNPSRFLRSVAQVYRKLDRVADYGQLVKSLEVVRRWATGMQLAMKFKPSPDDYDEVKRELALYFAEKMRLWPQSNTWYDNECIYTLGFMHERWGSLRLVSQEGMEAWQKKLNEVLRLGNGFANAGAIPKDVVRAGEAAKAAYIAKRLADKPSSAQWIYEQAMLQQHAYWQSTIAARDLLDKEGETIEWGRFTVYWQRYMVCAAMRCRLRARVLRGATRAQIARDASAPAGDDYTRLLKEHREYYAPVELTADDLDPVERRRQERLGRRERYAALEDAKVWGFSLWHA